MDLVKQQSLADAIFSSTNPLLLFDGKARLVLPEDLMIMKGRLECTLC